MNFTLNMEPAPHWDLTMNFTLNNAYGIIFAAVTLQGLVLSQMYFLEMCEVIGGDVRGGWGAIMGQGFSRLLLMYTKCGYQ